MTSSETKTKGPRQTRSTESAEQNSAQKSRKSIQSVEHGVRILQALMEQRNRDLPLKEVAERSGMSRSSAHRYLLAYANTGLVVQDSLSGHYSLGPMALKLGLAALARLDPVNQAIEELVALEKLTGHTGYLAIWGEYGPTVIRWIEGVVPILASVGLGSVLPLQNSSAGMAFLAFCPPARTEVILKAERKRGVRPNPPRLAAAIEQVRKQGYALTDDSAVPGVAAITAPVFDFQGWPVAVIGLVAQSTDTRFFAQANIAKVIAAAKRASLRNGWQEAAGPAVLHMT